MLLDGMMVQSGGRFVLTVKGWAWAEVWGAFRRFLGMGKGG